MPTAKNHLVQSATLQRMTTAHWILVSRLKMHYHKWYPIMKSRERRCERHFNGCAACVTGSDCRTASHLINMARKLRTYLRRTLTMIKRDLKIGRQLGIYSYRGRFM